MPQDDERSTLRLRQVRTLVARPKANIGTELGYTRYQL
jgi:hypothetical protein